MTTLTAEWTLAAELAAIRDDIQTARRITLPISQARESPVDEADHALWRALVRMDELIGALTAQCGPWHQRGRGSQPTSVLPRPHLIGETA